MRLAHWLGYLIQRPQYQSRHRLTSSRRQRTSTSWKGRQAAAAAVEQLENRTLLTVFGVNSFVDAVDANPGDGSSNDGFGNSTLRSAVMEANARFGSDEIVLGAGTYTLSLGGQDEDAAATGDLDITDSLAITGAGAGSTVIDAAELDRVFQVHPNVTFTLIGVTIRNGQTDDNGGGILNSGRLTLRNSVIEGNASGSRGGGVYNEDVLNLENTTFLGNAADLQGGGIYNNDSLTVIGTTFQDNSAGLHGGGVYHTLASGGTPSILTVDASRFTGNSAGSRGGAIFSDQALDVTESSFSDNTAGSRGGAIFTEGVATLTQSTVSGNTTSSRGGGLFNTGNLTLINSTVSGNSTLPGTSLSEKQGGGLFNDGMLALTSSTIVNNSAESGGGVYNLGGTVGLQNTVIAANTGSVADPDATGAFTSQSNNLIGNVGSATGLTHGVNFDQVGGGSRAVIDPRLGPLQDNGGPTLTHKPLAGSPLIDAGNNMSAPAADQRGSVRILDGDGNGSAVIDVGSVEYQVPPTPLQPVNSTVATQPTFSWSAVTGAMQYDLWVNDVTTGQSGIIREPNLTQTSFTPLASLPAGHRFQWAVRAVYPNGYQGDWSQIVYFSTKGILPATTLQGPLGTSASIRPQFSWTPVTEAVRYDIWVNNATTGQIGIIRNQNVTGTSFTPSFDLTRGHTYQWTVRAIDSQGNPGLWAPTGTFRVLDLSAPELQQPTGITIDTTPTFRWSDIPAAARYDIWVNDRTTGQSGVIRNTNVLTNEFTPNVPLTVGHEYIWTVRAVSSANEAGEWGAHRTFAILNASAAPAPTLTSPVATTIDPTPTFTWTAVPGAARYELSVDDLTTGQGQVLSATNITGTSFTAPTALEAGHEYRWRVRAFNDENSATEFSTSATFTLTAASQIAPPMLQGPIGTTIDATPTFSWTAVEGAARYDLWVNNATTGQNGVIRDQNVSGTTFTPSTPLTAGHTYTWTVRAINESGTATDFATARNFKIDNVVTAAAPTTATPAGPTIDATPTFTWMAVNGAIRYEIQIDNVTTGQAGVIVDGNVTSTSFTPQTALTLGQTYAWKVRAITDDPAFGQFSGSKTFTVSNAGSVSPPSLTGPIGRISGTQPTFQWTAVSGAARYDLWVNDLTTGQSGVIRQTNVTETSFTPTTPLTPGHAYIWTVRAINDQGAATEFASHKTFEVSAVISAPTPIAPPSTTTDTTPTFVWSSVSGAARYDLWVNDLTTGQSGIIRRTDLTSTAYTNVVPLTRGHSYIWTVRAISSAGAVSNWAAHRTFTIASANLIAPAADGGGSLMDGLNDGAEQESLPAPGMDSAGMLLADTAVEQPPELAADEVDDVMAKWTQTDWWNFDDRDSDQSAIS